MHQFAVESAVVVLVVGCFTSRFGGERNDAIEFERIPGRTRWLTLQPHAHT